MPAAAASPHTPTPRKPRTERDPWRRVRVLRHASPGCGLLLLRSADALLEFLLFAGRGDLGDGTRAGGPVPGAAATTTAGHDALSALEET